MSIMNMVAERDDYVAQIDMVYCEALERGDYLDLGQFDLTMEEIKLVEDNSMVEVLFRTLRGRDPGWCHCVAMTVMADKGCST